MIHIKKSPQSPFSKGSKNRDKNLGFSLIELIVSMAIMGIVFSGVMGAYIMLLQTRDRVNLEREMQKEVAFAITKMSDKIRNNSIDYAKHENATCPTLSSTAISYICLENKWSIKTVGTIEKTIQIEKDTNPGQKLLSKKFIVKKALFSITPYKNPYTPANKASKETQVQPLVQIYLSVESKRKAKNGTDPLVKMDIQTSVSSRKYQ